MQFVCPTTGLPLQVTSRHELEARLGPLLPNPRPAGQPPAVGATEHVLVRGDDSGAFPLVKGVPVLLGPEALVPAHRRELVDVTAAPYSEAYLEMDFYNDSPVENEALGRELDRLMEVEPSSFPREWRAWIDATYDGNAQGDCYRSLGEMTGRAALQIGGSGLHAVKFLMAGAASAVLVTPMLTEALRAVWLAERVGVERRLSVALGIAEEIPLADRSVDAAFAGGCVHHMVVPQAMTQVARALRPGGVFAAAEPWRAPLYGIGTRLLGKREANAHCTPLTKSALAGFEAPFDDVEITHHGAMLRYALLAGSKCGAQPSVGRVTRLIELDDRLSDRLRLRRWGSSVSLIGRVNSAS